MMNSQSYPDSRAGGNTPAISASEFQALIEMVGPGIPELVVDLLDTYLEESSGLVAALRAGVENGDRESILRPSHSLKSSSASIGAMYLSKLCSDLESHLRGSLPGLDVPGQVARISGEFSRVKSALEVERSKLLA